MDPWHVNTPVAATVAYQDCLLTISKPCYSSVRPSGGEVIRAYSSKPITLARYIVHVANIAASCTSWIGATNRNNNVSIAQWVMSIDAHHRHTLHFIFHFLLIGWMPVCDIGHWRFSIIGDFFYHLGAEYATAFFPCCFHPLQSFKGQRCASSSSTILSTACSNQMDDPQLHPHLNLMCDLVVLLHYLDVSSCLLLPIILNMIPRCSPLSHRRSFPLSPHQVAVTIRHVLLGCQGLIHTHLR